MKKVKKVLTSEVVTDVGVAPVWFVSAMEKVATKHDVQNVVPAWFAPAMEKVMVRIEHKISEAVAPLATKVELEEAVAPLATKVELEEAVAPLATKVDRLETKIDRLAVDLMFVRKAVSQLQRECLTKEAFEERMECYPTKDAFLSLMDEHARRIHHRDIQDPLFAKAITDQSDTIASHGKRLKAIEAKLAMSRK